MNKKRKQLKTFKTEKLRKDIIFNYIIYAYFDVGLREEQWVVQDKNGINVLNQMKLNNQSNLVKQDMKYIYNTTKRIFNQLSQEKVFKHKLIIGDIVKNTVDKEINKVFCNKENASILPLYLAISLLIKYKEDVKYKTLRYSIPYESLANISLDIEDGYPDKKIVEDTERAVYLFYKNIYKDESWFESEELKAKGIL